LMMVRCMMVRYMMVRFMVRYMCNMLYKKQYAS
jgi:hypothetical protein